MDLVERQPTGMWTHEGIFFFTEGEAINANPTQAGSEGEPAAMAWTREAPDGDGPRLVGQNIDSIYLSIYTEIETAKTERLIALRDVARERSDGDPVYVWGTDPRTGTGRTWQVTYTAPPYAVRLEIPMVASIRIARRPYAQSPQCYVEVRATALWQYGADVIIPEIVAMLGAWQAPGAPAPRVEVSRIDLAADFVDLGLDGSELFARRWLTRARWRRVDAVGMSKRERAAQKKKEREKSTADRGSTLIYHGTNYSGSAFGKGDVQCVLYDKSREIRDKGGQKKWMHEVWTAGGWDGEAPVWRVEVRLRKDALKALSATSKELTAIGANGAAPDWARLWGAGSVTVGNGLTAVIRALDGIWQYMTGEWLTLRDPDVTDDRRSRWPVSSLWRTVQAVTWGPVIGGGNTETVEVKRMRLLPREADKTGSGQMTKAAMQLRLDGGEDVVLELLRTDAIQAFGDGILREATAEKLRLKADSIGIEIDVQSAEARRDLLLPGLLGMLAAWDASCDVVDCLDDDPEGNVRRALVRLDEVVAADVELGPEYSKRRRRARQKAAWRGAVRLRASLAHHPGRAPGDDPQPWRSNSSTADFVGNS